MSLIILIFLIRGFYTLPLYCLYPVWCSNKNEERIFEERYTYVIKNKKEEVNRIALKNIRKMSSEGYETSLCFCLNKNP